MSHDKIMHHRDGRNGNGRSGGVPSQKSSPPPRSTLANLLSSQRRSAAQSDRYRVQMARPFADNTQVAKEAGNRGQMQPQKRWSNQSSSSTQGRGSDTNSYQTTSYRGSTNKGPSSTSSPDRRSTIPCQSGINCRKPTCEYMHDPETSASSRRVRFGHASSSESDSNTIKEVPRKRKSRWDVRPKVTIDDSSAKQQNNSLAERQSPIKSVGFVPPNKSILRKVERSAGESNDVHQKNIPMNSTALGIGVSKDGQSKTNNLATAYPRSSKALKGSCSGDLDHGISHKSGGIFQTRSNLTPHENSSPTLSDEKIIADDSSKITNETSNSMRPKKDETLHDARDPKANSKEHTKIVIQNDATKKNKKTKQASNELSTRDDNNQGDPKDSGEKLPPKIAERTHYSSIDSTTTVKSVVSPKSKIDEKTGELIKRRSRPKQESACRNGDTSTFVQDSTPSPKPKKKKRKANESNIANEMLPEPEPEPTKAKQDDKATSPGASPKKKRKKYFSPFRVKVGCVVAVRFRKLADGGNSEIVSVVKDGDSFCVPKPSMGKTLDISLKQSVATGRKGDETNHSEHHNKINKGPVDASNAETAQECPSNAAKESSTNNVVKQAAKEKNATKRSPKYFEVWSQPIPGQDDGLSLLGSWIRCAFPKSFIANWRKGNKNGTASSPGRIVEGNVVSILGNDRGSQGGIIVGLLVDRSSIKSLPYLQIVSGDSNDAMIRPSEQKRRDLEAKIRGENKVIVRVVLASVFDQRNVSKLDAGVVSQWVIRKRVVAKPAGKKPNKAERKRNKQHAHSLFVGDSSDTQLQQEQNWRWIASRTACQLVSPGMGHSVEGNNIRDSSSQLVGEVIKVSPKEEQDGSTTLATVTIKRLWTPEQTNSGRSAHHMPLELFDSSHDNSGEMYFEAPIEDLIVVGKRINRHFDVQKQPAADDPGWNFIASHSYHAGDDKYVPLCEEVSTKMPVKTCHHCQRLCHDSMIRKCHHENDAIESLWCARCLQLMNISLPCKDEVSWRGPCCTGKCKCRVCTSNAGKDPFEPNTSMVNDNIRNGVDKAFLDLVTSLHSTSSADFTLPNNMGQVSLRPSFVPITGNSKSKRYSKTRSKEEKKPEKKQGKHKKKRSSSDIGKKARKKLKTKLDVHPPEEEEEEDVFKPVCNRAIPFDQLNKKYWGTSKLKLAADDSKQPFFRENARPRVIKIGKTEEKATLTGRAARANQRRMFKSLAAMGDASKNVDRLAGRDREQQLRFDKSQIHGWGVFAEEQINAGDMIIEYRGEIIGNAVADKRELEYEKEKLDDYMFRIDAYTVCDATMLGNVARYINASCSPNCYTQIITAGENKRIVIYAKRDIHKGEELSYDYKFSLEYDGTKRIPCHCRSVECRGFMNWDKKYL